MIYHDDKFRVEIYSILAICDYVIYLDQTSVDVGDPLGLINYWSAVDPGCLILVRRDMTLVLNVQSVIFVSKDQVVLQGEGDAIRFDLDPGEYTKITECQDAVDEMVDNKTYVQEVEARMEEYLRRTTPALPPAPADPVIEASRSFLIDKYGSVFQDREAEE